MFSLALGFAGIWHIWWLAIAALVGIAATVIGYSFRRNDGHTIEASTVRTIEEKRSRALAAVEVS